MLHKGEILFRQGEMGSLFRLHTGLIKIVRVAADGNQLLLNLLLPEELFPHHSLVQNHPYHGTAIAVVDSEIEVIEATQWYASLASDPIRYREVAISLQERLRTMQRRIDQLTPTSAQDRLRLFESWFSTQFPDVELRDTLTQEEISQFIGLRRETVNRLLKQRDSYRK